MDTTIYNETYITVLTGQKPSTKTYVIKDGVAQKGEVIKPSYLYNYVTNSINNINDLYDIIYKTSLKDNSIIIRGRSQYKQDWYRTRTIKKDNEGTFTEHPTAWLCIDFDNQIVPGIERLSLAAIEWLINNNLPEVFHNSSYIYQWSSSAGLEYNNIPIKNGTNVHLFFYLDKGLVETELKGWFSNIEQSVIDKSVFQTVQPIFINANVNKDERIIDLIPLKDKIGIVHKNNPVVQTPEEIELTKYRERHSTAKSIDVDSANEIVQKL